MTTSMCFCLQLTKMKKIDPEYWWTLRADPAVWNAIKEFDPKARAALTKAKIKSTKEEKLNKSQR